MHDDIALVFVEALHAFAVVFGGRHFQFQLLVLPSGFLLNAEDYAFLLS